MDNHKKLKNLEIKRREILDEIKELERRVFEKHQAVKMIERQKKYLIKDNKKSSTLMVSEYDSSLPWKKKIAYAITTKGSPNMTEIVDVLVENEKDRKKVYQTVQRTLLRMIIQLEVIKIGKYNSRYELNV